MTKFIKNLVSIADSSIIVLIVFFVKIDPVKCIEGYLPTELALKLSEPGLRNTINTAIILLVIHIIMLIFSRPIRVGANLNNLDGTSSTSLSIASINSRPRKLNLDIDIDYKSKFLKWIVKIIGGLYIKVENTTWTSLDADKQSPLFENAIDDNTTNDFILIDINKFLTHTQTKNRLRVNLNIISDLYEPMEGTIKVDFCGKNDRKISNLILKILINYEECVHMIQSSREG